MTISKVLLSGGTDGKSIKVTQAASPGDTVHTADASAKDEIFLWATNTDSTDRTVTVQFGGTTSPDDDVPIVVPSKTTMLIVPGWLLTNSEVLKVFASAANVVTVNGYVNRHA